ncbi:SPASM domain-containing protein [Desulfolutivibrio sp.]|uniref:SPASM domain-containing protein n=1 Tax=Desulfolutivibrio sp. TaxID=2773296 RepID=UPI002F961A88
MDTTEMGGVCGATTGEGCFLLARNLVVAPDGAVTACCNDLSPRGGLGSTLDSDFTALAGHPARQERLGLFREGRMAEIALCRDCSGFYAPPRRGEKA